MLVIPAFEVDADVLNHDSSALTITTNVDGNRICLISGCDGRIHTDSIKSGISIDALQDGHPAKRCTHQSIHSSIQVGLRAVCGLNILFLYLKNHCWIRTKQSFVHIMAAARFSFIVVPDVFVIHVHTDKSIGVKLCRIRTNSKLIKGNRYYRVSKDFTVGWSCWRPFVDRIDRIWI